MALTHDEVQRALGAQSVQEAWNAQLHDRELRAQLEAPMRPLPPEPTITVRVLRPDFIVGRPLTDRARPAEPFELLKAPRSLALDLIARGLVERA